MLKNKSKKDSRKWIKYIQVGFKKRHKERMTLDQLWAKDNKIKNNL